MYNGLWGEGLVWFTGHLVCPLAAKRGSNVADAGYMDGRIVH